MNGFLAAPLAKGLVDASYLLTAFLFITGLKRMSSPVTAKSGVIWAGWGMLVATVVTFIDPEITANYVLIVSAIFVGGLLAWWTGKRVAMTDMPQMIALYNGMGGGAAAAIAAVELLRMTSEQAGTAAVHSRPAARSSASVVLPTPGGPTRRTACGAEPLIIEATAWPPPPRR